MHDMAHIQLLYMQILSFISYKHLSSIVDFVYSYLNVYPSPEVKILLKQNVFLTPLQSKRIS